MAIKAVGWVRPLGERALGESSEEHLRLGNRQQEQLERGKKIRAHGLI